MPKFKRIDEDGYVKPPETRQDLLNQNKEMVIKDLEGFVKVEVNKEGHQSWDLQNWFASLDPDKDEAQHQKIIEDIKKRLNADTGIINPSKKQEENFLNIFSQ